MTFWTDERIAALTRMWNVEGLTATQIEHRFGYAVTRNAVIGKVNRLGLASRTTDPRGRNMHSPFYGKRASVNWAERRRVIVEVQARGGVARDAAAILGISMHAVHKAARKLLMPFPMQQRTAPKDQRPPVSLPKSPRPPMDREPAIAAPEPPVSDYDASRRANGAIPFIEAPFIGRCKMFLAGESGPYGLTCAASIPVGASWCHVHQHVVSASVPTRRENVFPARR